MGQKKYNVDLSESEITRLEAIIHRRKSENLITTLLKFEQILLIYVKPVHQNDSKDEIC